MNLGFPQEETGTPKKAPENFRPGACGLKAAQVDQTCRHDVQPVWDHLFKLLGSPDYVWM